MILIKTRKIHAYAKFVKHEYIYLYISQLINISKSNAQLLNLYGNYILSEVTKNIWFFYKNLLISDQGTYSSNYTKSVMYKTVSKLLVKNSMAIHAPVPSYLGNFELYNFNIAKQPLKKLIIFFLSLIPYNYYCYNINFSVYNNYFWLHWYLKFNPMNNVFYLKVYNY